MDSTRPILCLIALPFIATGLWMQISALGHRSDKHPPFPCLNPKYYFVGRKEAVTWFTEERMYRRMRNGGILGAIGCSLGSISFLFF